MQNGGFIAADSSLPSSSPFSLSEDEPACTVRCGGRLAGLSEHGACYGHCLFSLLRTKMFALAVIWLFGISPAGRYLIFYAKLWTMTV